MAKVRIYEIANELKIQSKDVIEFLKEKNIMKKTASSAIEDDVIDMVRGKFTGGKSESRKPQPESAGQSFGKSKEEPVKTESIKTETAQTAKTEPEKAVTAKAESQHSCHSDRFCLPENGYFFHFDHFCHSDHVCLPGALTGVSELFCCSGDYKPP